MNKLIFAFIFIILFINAYTSTDESECKLSLTKIINIILSSTELTEDDCKELKTVDDTIYKCSLSSDKKSCLEVEKSTCEKKIITETSRRMLSRLELNEDDCKTLQIQTVVNLHALLVLIDKNVLKLRVNVFRVNVYLNLFCKIQGDFRLTMN